MWNEKFGDALERGNLMHWYMAQIKQETDIPFASELLLRNGMASESQKEDLETIARNIVSNPMVKPFFSGAHKTYNERDILDPEGNISRPDRINIISKNEAVIIDYKSSQPDSIDQKQLNGYRFALHQMGYEFVKNILIYVSEDTTPEFVVF